MASDETPTLSDLPKHVASIDDLIVLLECVKSSQICPGNPVQNVDMIAKERGNFLGADGEVVETLDASSDGERTVRVNDCVTLNEN